MLLWKMRYVCCWRNLFYLWYDRNIVSYCFTTIEQFFSITVLSAFFICGTFSFSRKYVGNKGTLVCDDILFTNDVAQLYPDHSFVILGEKTI